MLSGNRTLKAVSISLVKPLASLVVACCWREHEHQPGFLSPSAMIARRAGISERYLPSGPRNCRLRSQVAPQKCSARVRQFLAAHLSRKEHHNTIRYLRLAGGSNRYSLYRLLSMKWQHQYLWKIFTVRSAMLGIQLPLTISPAGVVR